MTPTLRFHIVASVHSTAYSVVVVVAENIVILTIVIIVLVALAFCCLSPLTLLGHSTDYVLLAELSVLVKVLANELVHGPSPRIMV